MQPVGAELDVVDRGASTVAPTALTPAAEAPAPATPRPSRMSRGGRALAWIVPSLALTVIVLRHVVPSRLEGMSGGLTGALAWLGDNHPLVLGIALFLAISEALRYWGQRLVPAGAVPSADSRPAGGRSMKAMLLALAVVACVAYALRSTVAGTFNVSGPSMLPTLDVGDRLLVNRLAYGVHLPFTKTALARRVPGRGDLVVFRGSGLMPGGGPEDVVKRVMGVPGDTVSVVEGELRINGWTVPTCDAGPYAQMLGRLMVRGRLTVEYLEDKTYLTVRVPFERTFAEYTVQPGEVFVMGDDRGMSSDSRLWNERRGAGVPVTALEGRLVRVLFGGRPDGRLDLSRLWAKWPDLKVRIPGIDMGKTDERIANCLERRPAVTWPPPGNGGPTGIPSPSARSLGLGVNF